MKVRDVVLLHGWGSGAGVWDDFAWRLEPRFRVHAPPLPGYGADASAADGSFEAIVSAIARAVPRHCGVVGWSLGGEVALAWARRAPRQVRRLVLISTTPCFTAKPGWTCATAPAVLQEFGRSIVADRAGTLARFVAVQAKGDARARRVAAVLQRLYERNVPGEVLAEGITVLASVDLRGELFRLEQPALVLHGARDRIVSPVAGRWLGATLPRGRFRLLRTCAHAPFLSQPERVARAVREFFDD